MKSRVMVAVHFAGLSRQRLNSLLHELEAAGRIERGCGTIKVLDPTLVPHLPWITSTYRTGELSSCARVRARECGESALVGVTRNI